MDVHFFGPVALTRAALPHMRERGAGAIVQISSMGGQPAFPGRIRPLRDHVGPGGLSEALAGEAAPFGIGVLIVEPGSFRTRLHGAAMHETTPLPAYDHVVGPARAAQRAMTGTEPGDPAKAAAAVLATLDRTDGPLRAPTSR
jgi:NAD(P)-dependent dehydrogenase (short-subunit alcohol dehydrogenase family)